MDTAGVRAAYRRVSAGEGEFSSFQSEALAFADRWRADALAHAARMYVSAGVGRATFKPLVTGDGFVELLDWSLDRPDRFPDRRAAALALALSVIPDGELAGATPEERYLTLHGAVEKSLEAQRELIGSLPDILGKPPGRKPGLFSFLARR